MDSVMGLVGDGFTLVVADANAGRSIMVFKNDQDKIMNLDESKIMGLAGPTADCSNFSEYVQKNMTLYELNNNMRLSTWATANFIRGELATALRKGPFQTNILLGGYEPDAGSSLYYMDYMGAMSKVNFGAHGYCSNFCLSIFDREWKEGLTVEEGLEIVQKCINELAARFMIAQPNFVIKIVDAQGTRRVELPKAQ